MKTEETKPSNPRMHNPDGQYASEARNEDYVSLRDEFAKAAMGTILNHKMYDGQQIHELNESRFLNTHWDSEVTEKEKEQALKCVLDEADFIAKRAYLMADAMLKQREL